LAGTASIDQFALTENKALRLFAFFVLYFGQGLPIGVSLVAFPAWLVANGASEADVAAVVATAFLPWSFKFIPAAFMDRYAYLVMGRRRAWLILAQLLMVFGFGLAALIAPGPEDIDIVVYVVFLIGAGSAIQDVAVDGLAVDLLPEADQGVASAFMFGGQTIGRASAGASGGFLLQFFGSQTAFLAFLPLILLVTIFVISFRERPGERRLPWSSGGASQVNIERHVGAWAPMMISGFKSILKRDSIKLVIASSLARCTAGFFSTMWPILAVGTVGFTTASYASMISVVDLVMAIVAIGLGSLLTTFVGPRRSTVLVWTSYGVLALGMYFGQSLWIGTLFFIAASCLWSLHDTLSSICSNPLRMQLSDPKVAATQFTIYNSISNLPVSIGATIFAALGGTEQLGLVMSLAAGLAIAGAMVFARMTIGDRPALVEPEPRIA